MKVGVVADTHMPSRAKRLPKALMDGLAGVDQILHLGDWTDLEVLYWLEEIAPVDGIAGNNDGDDMERRFGRTKVLSLGGRRIGLHHGDGWRSAADNAWHALFPAKPDVILFGHSHVPLLEHRGSTLLFNPGSPTDKRRQPSYSFGLLELGAQITATHIYFSERE